MKCSLEFIRFIFICIIAIWHDNTLNIFRHSVVVEFFFILSGFLLYQTYQKRTTEPIEFAKRRIKRLYCEYSIALIITFFINIIKEHPNELYICNQIGSLIPELLMVQNIGIFKGGINPINWYIQVMLIGSIFLYALLYCNPKLAKNVLIPTIALGGLTYFFSTGDSIVHWETNYFIYYPLLRGLSCMSIGILSAWIHIETNNNSRLRLLFINVASIFTILLILIATIAQNPLDKYVIMLTPIAIIACFEEKSWLNKIFHAKWQLWLGHISYAMLLIHCAYIPIYHKILSEVHSILNVEIPLSLSITLYLLTLTLTAAIFQRLCDIIREHCTFLLK